MKRKIVSCILILIVLSLLMMTSVSAAGNWIDISDKEPVKDYAYAFVVVGDTQVLCYRDSIKGTDYMSQIYDWIIENKEEKKIEYVFGLGDITDNSTVKEWEIAKEPIPRETRSLRCS